MFEFNAAQIAAIEAEEPKVVIVAPPGSGKTFTMTAAIEHFYKTNDEPKRVVAVTFTNKAAEDLHNRIGIYLPVEVATIHSWSYNELVRLSKKHFFRIKLLDDTAVEEILLRIMPQYGIQTRYLRGVYNHCLGNVNPDLPHYIKSKYNAIKDRYIDYKRKMYLYDFTDLPLYLSDMLEHYGETIELDAIFVDEFQDVDPVQLEVFNKIAAKKKFFIGDVDQAIYQFRGAVEEIFERLDGFHLYVLKTNYRSHQEIINFAFHLKGMETREAAGVLPSAAVKAERGDGAFILYDTGVLWTAEVYKSSNFPSIQHKYKIIREELEKYNYQVLCRTNKEVRDLRAMGLTASTIHQAKGLEYENVMVIDFDARNDEDINIKFVANTRAKNRLMLVQFETIEKIKNQIEDINKAF